MVQKDSRTYTFGYHPTYPSGFMEAQHLPGQREADTFDAPPWACHVMLRT